MLRRSQQIRRYASEPPKSEPSNAILYSFIGAAGLAGGYFYLRKSDSQIAQKASAVSSSAASSAAALMPGTAKKAFTGGEQGFLSLLLEKSEVINHNTKKLTFKLPEPDMESGLPVACKLFPLCYAAAC